MKKTSIKETSYMIGSVFFLIYVFLLYFHPETSWYDETYWTDLGRNIGINGQYHTWVWGTGQPSYSPLYAYLLAVWFKVFGFSYFNAHFPAILIVLVSYLIFCNALKDFLLSKSNLIIFSILFWLSPEVFWIYNCGRVDVLCVLLSIITIVFFVKSYNNVNVYNMTVLFASCCLLLWTGFQGVFFTTLFIIIFFLIDIRMAINQKKRVFLNYIGSCVFSLITLSAFMLYHNSLKAFFRTTFGFSNTVNIIEAFDDFVSTGSFKSDTITFNAIETSNNISDIFSKMTIDGILFNLSYWMLLSLATIGLIYLIIKKQKFSKLEAILIILPFATPLFFILLGRYATYYTWTGYLSAVVFFTIIISKIQRIEFISAFMSAVSLVWFIVCPYKNAIKNVDLYGQTDASILKDIADANLDFNKSSFVPYEWYYYLINQGYENKMFFKGSGHMPLDLELMILDDDDYETWSKRFELKYIRNIGVYREYKIISEIIPTRW